MMKWLTPKEVLKDSLESDIDIYNHIERLWTCNNDLATLLKSMTEVMKGMAEAYQIQKAEIEQLARQTLQIAEQQNRLLSHVLRKDDIRNEEMESTSLH